MPKLIAGLGERDITEWIERRNSAPYVRQSSNPADSRPYQVRRNLPDQTYVVEGRYSSAQAAYAHVDQLD